jgi:cytochrome c oxidase assembly protein subunit 15
VKQESVPELLQPQEETWKGWPRANFPRYAGAVLWFNVAVILWGAFVRATGSGAGCGNHWPLCDGSALLVSPSIHKIIEYTHRAMTGADTPLILVLCVWAFRAFPPKQPVRRAAVLSVVFLITEALLGALLVKLGHVAQNADIYTLSLHLVNTLTLLACLTLTAWFGGGNLVPQLRGKAAWTAAISLAGVVILSITGAIAALGDTLYPAASLAAGLAQDLHPGGNWLLRLRAIHPLLALAVAVWLAFYSITRLRGARVTALRVIVVVWIQLMAGLVNFLLQAPVWMQIVHLLIADLLWNSLVLLCATPTPTETALPRRAG